MTILSQSGVFSWALQWGKYGDGTITAAKAIARIILSGNPTAADTVTIGATTYKFVAAVSDANDVLIGTDAAETVANLVLAVGAGTGAGTKYGTGTSANAEATAVGAFYTVFLTAASTGTAGNSTILAKSSTVVTLVPFAYGATAGTFDLTKLSYHRHRVPDADYDAGQDTRVFPLEVGSAITPTGEYKAGAFAGGGATLIPRLEDTFGELLFGAMGTDTVQQNTPVTGTHTHTFKFNPNAVEDIPWFAVRKMTPGRGLSRPLGVTGIDNKLAMLRLMVPQNDIMTARVDFIGRIPKFDPYADAWLYANEYENADKTALSCRGYFKLPTIFQSAELPVTSIVIELINNTTTPREEMRIGDYFPDDYVVRGRAMQIRLVHKWDSPELYSRAFTNSANGTDWSPQPFVTTYNAGNYAVDIQVQGAKNIGATSEPYALRIRAASVAWEPVGPIRLQGGSIVMVEYRGTVLEPDAALGVPYAEIQLVNGRSSAYAVPVQP